MSPKEFERFFQANFRKATYQAQLIVMSKEIAEDIVQDVFIKLLDREDLFTMRITPTYLNTCVRNAAIDYIRSQASRIFVQLNSINTGKFETSDLEVLAAEEAEYTANLHRLYDAIEALPEQARKAVHLVCFEKYSYNDAAEKLDISVNTLKTHLYRSFKKLRKHLAVLLMLC